ncbi:hypothetical protein, partial [Halopseudomonas sp.]|uniref:hypothetical protein n=1 Tax=Halopseudomonas sp. TaxID=2901191 RepID=UPI003001B48E
MPMNPIERENKAYGEQQYNFFKISPLIYPVAYKPPLRREALLIRIHVSGEHKHLINIKERSVAMDIALCLITPLSNTRLDVH